MKKTLLFIAGWLLLVVGVIGLLVPVMPTTPFVVLAAVCFSYSSPRFYARLRKLPYFGPYIENYKTKKGVSLKDKLRVLIFLWGGISISMLFIAITWATITLSAIGITVTVHILWLRTREPESAEPNHPNRPSSKNAPPDEI